VTRSSSTPRPRALCSFCGRETALRPDGKLYPHYRAGSEAGCKGSGTAAIERSPTRSASTR